MDSIRSIQMDISELTPSDRNARKHTEKDIQAIIESIKEFGFLDPIGVWGPQNVIVEGHGRYEAARRLGMQTVTVIRLDALTDKQRRAYALAHNKTAEKSKWDVANLFLELDALEDKYDMSKFGFPDRSINDEYTGDGAIEYDGDEFADEKFECECPYCGFKFNP